MKTPFRFTLRWVDGKYKVSKPNIETMEVVSAADHDQIVKDMVEAGREMADLLAKALDVVERGKYSLSNLKYASEIFNDGKDLLKEIQERRIFKGESLSP